MSRARSDAYECFDETRKDDGIFMDALELVVLGRVLRTRARFEFWRLASPAFRRESRRYGGWAWFPVLEEDGRSLELYRKPDGAWALEVIVQEGPGGEEFVEHYPLRSVGEAVHAYAWRRGA